MRRLRYILVAFALVVALSCHKDSIPTTHSDEADVDTVIISMDLYGGSSSRATAYSLQEGVLGEAEYYVNSLRVYIFASNGSLDKMVKYDDLNANQLIGQKIEVPKDTSKEIYFVANEPEALEDKLDAATSAEELEQLNFEIAEAMNGGFNGDAKFASGEFWMPMSAKYSVGNAMADIQIYVGLTRAVARVDLYLSKGDDAASRSVELDEDTKFYVDGVSYDTSLFEGTVEEQTTLESFELASSDMTISSSTSQRVLSFYTAERTYDHTDSGSAITITVDGIVEDGKRQEAKSVTLGDETLSELNRDYVYRIYGTYNGTEIEAGDLEIMKWEDVEIDAEIEGVMVAVDSEVAMDWLLNGNSYACKQISFGSNKAISFYLPVIVGSGSDLSYEFKLYEFESMEAGSSYSLKDINLTNNYIFATSWIESATIHFTSQQSGYIEFVYTPVKVNYTIQTYPIRIKSDNVTKQMKAVYDNGYLPASLLSDEWASRAPGGVLFAKRGEANHPLTTPEILYRDDDGYYRGEHSITGGEISTYCSDTFGYGWYMPSYSEMVEIAEKFDMLGVSYRFQNNGSADGLGELTESRYWTSSASSEFPCYYWTADFMSRDYMNVGLMERRDGGGSYFVRCVMDLQ